MSLKNVIAGAVVSLVLGVVSAYMLTRGIAPNPEGRESVAQSVEATPLPSDASPNAESSLSGSAPTHRDMPNSTAPSSEEKSESVAPKEIAFEQGTVADSIFKAYESFEQSLTAKGTKPAKVKNDVYALSKFGVWGDYVEEGSDGPVVSLAQGPTTTSECVSLDGEFIDSRDFKIKWDKIGMIYYPADEQGGPKGNHGGVRDCYEHSLKGAVMAATNHLYQFPSIQEFSSSEKQHIVVSEYLREFYSKIDFRHRVYGSVESLNPELKYVQPIGYRILNIDRTAAKVMIYVAFVGVDGSIKYNGFQVSVIWEKGDWRIVYKGNPNSVVSTAGGDIIYFSKELEGKYREVYKLDFSATPAPIDA